jgi:hypothetical protein
MRRERSGLLARLWAALVAFFASLFGFSNHKPDEPSQTSIQPLSAGVTAPDVTIPSRESHARLQRAFAAAVVGNPNGAADLADVVWVDGDNELLVRPSRLRVVFQPGFALVGIAVHTEQTGDVEVVVPFALGRPDEPIGLVAATEPKPRGPAQIVDTWADPLVASAWDALLRVATDAAGAAGVDDQHERLLPAALVAGPSGLTVTPQARHAFDRRTRWP